MLLLANLGKLLLSSSRKNGEYDQSGACKKSSPSFWQVVSVRCLRRATPTLLVCVFQKILANYQGRSLTPSPKIIQLKGARSARLFMMLNIVKGTFSRVEC
ncbi:MAG: hypothetical protein ACYTX0_45470, partial [Nostoc sp.]